MPSSEKSLSLVKSTSRVHPSSDLRDQDDLLSTTNTIKSVLRSTQNKSPKLPKSPKSPQIKNHTTGAQQQQPEKRRRPRDEASFWERLQEAVFVLCPDCTKVQCYTILAGLLLAVILTSLFLLWGGYWSHNHNNCPYHEQLRGQDPTTTRLLKRPCGAQIEPTNKSQRRVELEGGGKAPITTKATVITIKEPISAKLAH